MPYSAKVIKVMIASPSDVETARGIVREVIRSWNDVHSEEKAVVLMPVSWETHSSPSMDAPPQAVINRQVLDDCDLLVAVFWTRLGTPTESSPSGTVEEIERHLAKNKPAMIYFSDEPVRLDSVDDAQYQALRDFRTTCEKRGLIERFSSLAEFRDMFARHLALKVIGEFAPRSAEETNPIEPASRIGDWPILPQIGQEARRLLVEASKDPNATIMHFWTAAGLTIQTNGISFVEERNPRSEALWERAIDQLVRYSLIGDRGHKREVFQLTADGYELADYLQKNA
jgi:hypothetical protein